jgi:hypothetical protein
MYWSLTMPFVQKKDLRSSILPIRKSIVFFFVDASVEDECY